MAKSNRKQALGRGLSALLNDSENHIKSINDKNSDRLIGAVINLDLNRITTNPFQPRTHFNEETLEELSQSVKELGVIQPITVRKKGSAFELITGERRLRASEIAGLKTIPAFVRLANDQESLEMALVENIQRENLDPIEIALCYQRLINEVMLTQDQMSKRVGKKRSTIANYVRLLKLDPIIQSGIRDGFITMGHGRALLSFENKEDQLNLYKKILKKSLSVREVESLTTKKPSINNNNVNIEIPLNFRNELIKLKKYINNNVNIKLKNKEKGSIIFPFNNIEEFKTIIKNLNAKK